MTFCRRLTLGLCEFAFLDTGLNSLVEHDIELSFRRDGNLVVGFDIFLDRLAAVAGGKLTSRPKWGLRSLGSL